MEEINDKKEITIVPPEGYEIDKENSTLGHIVFKKIETKPYRWRDDKYAKMDGYYIVSRTSEVIPIHNVRNYIYNYNVFATEKQAKSVIAMARISQIMANDKRFGGVVTDEEWKNDNITKYLIIRLTYSYKTQPQFIISRDYTNTIYNFLAFHTWEQRELFIKENEDLVKDFLMID